MLGGGRLRWRRAATMMWTTEGCVGRWLRCSGAPNLEVATRGDDGGRETAMRVTVGSNGHEGDGGRAASTGARILRRRALGRPQEGCGGGAQ
ncbi:hypothetical protein E2562_011341 [Oryza meyeriana var. granulata]|uniref:DUF834 domain-containing protein n=1 Tax=Oryza meyeriana var. granulata TaxID=110450 RepID=A0A6G1BX71_9ORYZ|nr:hypothetical protein E2562_011341 [Oryza meyeriana var. granulata]